MKYAIIFTFFTLFINWGVNGQFFNQDFNVSNTATNYVAATPNIRQFDGFNTTGSATMTVTTTEGLNFIGGAMAKAAATRVTDIAGIGTTTNAYIVRLNITQCTGTSAGNAIAAQIQFGSGFNNNSTVEVNNKVFGEFYIHNSGTNNQFRTSPEGTTLSTSTAVGTTNAARITVAFNKSGSSKSYMPPSATNPPFTLETVATGTMDIWIGTTIMSNDVAIPAGFTTANITDFKIIFAPSISTTLSLDDISMFPIGTPAGTYTLGVDNSGANPVSTVMSTFTSLTRNGGGLFEVLNYSGAILGNVTANVTNSTIAAINPENGVNDLKEITGMAGNTISILPASAGVKTIEGTQNGNLILFNGADKVLVDGNNAGTLTLLFRNNDTGNNANNSVFNFINDATNNTVKNAIVEGLHTANNTGLIRISTTTATTGNDNLTFENLTIQNSSISLPAGGTSATTTTNVPRCAIFSDGTVSKENSTISIKNCRFVNIYSGANNSRNVLISSNTQNLTLEDCHFFQTVSFFGNGSNTSYSNLIEIGGTGTDNVTVRNNFFGGRALNCGGAKYVYSNPNNNRNRLRIISSSMAATANLTFTGNTIQNVQIDFQGTTTAGQDAFGVFNGSGKAVVSNNIIGSTTIANSFAFSQTTNNAVTHTTAGIQYINFTGTAGEIKNNIIAGQTYTFADTPTFGFDIIGIRLANSGAGVEVSGNIIGSTTQTDNILVSNTTSANFFSGITIVATGTNSSTIQNNNIQNITNNSTNVGSTIVGISQTGTANTTIQNNTISNLSSQSTAPPISNTLAVAAISINAVTNSTVTNNTIHTLRSLQSAATGTTAAGILFTGSVSGAVNKNIIYNIRNTSGGTLPVAAGIVMRSIGTGLMLTNNMISLGVNADDASDDFSDNATPNTDDTMFIGIWNNLNDTDNLNIIYNSISIAGSTAGGSTKKTYAFLRGVDGSTGVATLTQIFNNAFHNARTGGGNHYGIGNRDVITNWINPASCSGYNSPDFNAYYVADDVNNVGEWLGIAYTFAGWQTISGQDANSLNINALAPLSTPLRFKNISKGDLHVDDTGTDAEKRLDAEALPLPALTFEDVDGQFRRGPDIGVDEVENTLVFLGPTDNWHDPNNWDLKVVPSCADNVLINTQNVKIYAVNSTAYCYSLTIASGRTLEVETGAKLENCWLKGTTILPYPATHNGFIDIQAGGTLIANNADIKVSGEFVGSGTFTKGNSTAEINFDRPSVFSCLADYIESFNNKVAISDINVSVNTNFHNLTILNSGVTTISSTKDVTVGDATTKLGIFDITDNSTFIINGNKLSLEGTLAERTGTITGSATSKLHILGKGDFVGTLKFTSASTEDFQEVVVNRIDNGAVKGLAVLGNANLRINNFLDLTAGILKTGTIAACPSGVANFEVSVTNNSLTAVRNYNSLGYVTTGGWVWGKLRRAVTGTGLYSFPVGGNARYQLFNLDIKNALAGTTSILGYFNQCDAPNNTWTANDVRGSLTFVYNNICTSGYWRMTPNNAPSGLYDVEIFPVNIICAGTYKTIGKSVEGAGVYAFGGSTYQTDTKRTGYTSFSDFSLITTIVVLPIELISFTATAQKSNALIAWETVWERNNNYFEVEKSIDGKNFITIRTVKGNGTSANKNSYQLIDSEPYKGTNYYRLKQIDIDGTANYSKIISLYFDGNAPSFTIFPNPTKGLDIKIIFTTNIGNLLNIKVIDALGRSVYTENLSYQGQVISIKSSEPLANGIYFVNIYNIATGEIHSKKLIIE